MNCNIYSPKHINTKKLHLRVSRVDEQPDIREVLDEIHKPRKVEFQVEIK